MFGLITNIFFEVVLISSNLSPIPCQDAFFPYTKNGTSAPMVEAIFIKACLFKFNLQSLFKATKVEAAFELAPPRPDPVGIFFLLQ